MWVGVKTTKSLFSGPQIFVYLPPPHASTPLVTLDLGRKYEPALLYARDKVLKTTDFTQNTSASGSEVFHPLQVETQNHTVLEQLCFFWHFPFCIPFLVYVRHGDKAAFKWPDMDIFDTGVTFCFWQREARSGCGRRIPASLTHGTSVRRILQRSVRC